MYTFGAVDIVYRTDSIVAFGWLTAAPRCTSCGEISQSKTDISQSETDISQSMLHEVGHSSEHGIARSHGAAVCMDHTATQLSVL